MTQSKDENIKSKESDAEDKETQQYGATSSDASNGAESKQTQPCLQRNSSDKENGRVCQNLLESPPRIPLSPRKRVNVLSASPVENDSKETTFKENMDSTVNNNSHNSCKENQRTTEDENGGSARKKLSWPNSIEFSNHKKPNNPCQGCKVVNDSPVKRVGT